MQREMEHGPDGPDKTDSFSRREDILVESDSPSTPADNVEPNGRSGNGNDREEGEKEEPNEANLVSNFHKFSQEVDRFAESANARRNQDPDGNPPDIPSSVDIYIMMAEREIVKVDTNKESGKWLRDFNEDATNLLQAIGKVSTLTDVLGTWSSNSKYASLINRMSNSIQRAMTFLEEEFRSLLEDCSVSTGESGTSSIDLKKKQPSFKSNNTEGEQGTTQEPHLCNGTVANFPGYSPEIVTRLNMIANVMIVAGYETECCKAYSIARRQSLEEGLAKTGFEKISIEDVQKMNWEPLEGLILTWIKACKLCITSYFSGEKNLCDAVFRDHPSISCSLLGNLARAIVIQFLNFAEAVAMTKRSAERLFKFLDIHETLRDLIESMDSLFPGEMSPELKSETTSARSCIGEAAVSIFSDLENSIKADSGKTPVPGGAVHPLTRYVMNYVKYACEYKDTLEQVFRDHQKSENSNTMQESESNVHNGSEENRSPFSVQLLMVMDLLDSNLNAKAKLYKDPSLSYIFLMNNGRYIMQKVKGSMEIHNLLGDAWRRKRSSDLRQYHKNYQRETWSKVLACLRDDGLTQGKGSVVKPMLKERFKSFNSMIDDIHKTQSTWVVSDEQLQSELRVSIGAVVIPAYRSFLGRFHQFLDPGRQTEKYVKYGPEELEAAIDELFDGTPTLMTKKKS